MCNGNCKCKSKYEMGLEMLGTSFAAYQEASDEKNKIYVSGCFNGIAEALSIMDDVQYAYCDTHIVVTGRRGQKLVKVVDNDIKDIYAAFEEVRGRYYVE